MAVIWCPVWSEEVPVRCACVSLSDVNVFVAKGVMHPIRPLVTRYASKTVAALYFVQ